MARRLRYADWHPTTEQELLLKAALFHGASAVAAWEQWRAVVDLEGLDYGSYRLLPLLYFNLKNAGVIDPAFANFKRLYLETWADNQLLVARTVQILKALQHSNIPTLILKGVDLINRYYPNFGTRPMSDLDILVPTDKALDAIKILRSLGYIPDLKNPDKHLSTHLRINHALGMFQPEGIKLDLHWHVLTTVLGEDADWDFWESAVPFTTNDVKTFTLNPTDAFFHTCIHGLHWNKLPPIRWVADAVMILNTEAALDWVRLVELARSKQMSLILQDALNYLRNTFNSSIPEDIITTLQAIPVTREERREHKAQTQRPILYATVHWASYPRLSKDLGLRPGLFGFIGYYLAINELDHLWQVPLLSFKKIKGWINGK